MVGCGTGLLAAAAAAGCGGGRPRHRRKIQVARLGGGRGASGATTGTDLATGRRSSPSSSGVSHSTSSSSEGVSSGPATAPSSTLRQLVCRVRSGWRRQAAVWCAGSAAAAACRRHRFAYDPKSYSQNFDDGCFPEHEGSDGIRNKGDDINVP